jgi:predicted ester cyclase
VLSIARDLGVALHRDRVMGGWGGGPRVPLLRSGASLSETLRSGPCLWEDAPLAHALNCRRLAGFIRHRREGNMKQQVTTCQQTWIDGLNRGDVSAGDKAFTSDCIIHITGSPERNLPLAGFKQMIGGLLAAFPDLRVTIEDQVIAGDKIATRWTAEGTHAGPLGEVKPTGKRVRIDGMILDRVVGDRVAERWEQWDQMAMMQQLGLVG